MRPRRASAVLSFSLLAVALLAAARLAGGSLPSPDFQMGVDVTEDGPTLTYTVHFDNVGAAAAPRAVLTDALPSGAAYLGTADDLVDGVWTRTYENVTVGAHTVTISAQLPDSVRDGDRIVSTVSLRYTDLSGAWITSTYAQEFAVALGVTSGPAPSVPTWVVALPVALAIAAGGGVAIRSRRRPKVEQVFLMHSSGMLIHHWAATSSPSRDIDILSGMFVILKEFVRDSFREKTGGLTELRFGDSRIFLAEAPHAVLAAVVSGARTNGLPGEVASAVDDFERMHGTALDGWNGRLDGLPGAKAVVDGLVHGRYRNWRMT